MSTAFTIDTREFRQAIAEYSVATRKSVAESAHRGMRNFMVACAMKAAEHESDTRGNIEGLQRKEWWWKYVAKALANSRGSKFGQRGFQAMWSEAHGGRGVSARTRGRHEARVRQMRKMSDRLIGRYLKAVGFIKFFFVYGAGVIEKETGIRSGPGVRSRKLFSGFRGYCRTPKSITESSGDLVTDMLVAYDFKRRGQKSAAKAERSQLEPIMRRTLPETIADIQTYAQKKMAAVAAQHSAKAA